MDVANNRALVEDPCLDAVVAVDLTTGARTILSNNTTPDNTTPFVNSQGIALDATNNRALVVDITQAMVIAVDLTTGARSPFFDAVVPDPPTH